MFSSVMRCVIGLVWRLLPLHCFRSAVFVVNGYVKAVYLMLALAVAVATFTRCVQITFIGVQCCGVRCALHAMIMWCRCWLR
jgi:hypothetical protein